MTLGIQVCESEINFINLMQHGSKHCLSDDRVCSVLNVFMYDIVIDCIFY